MVFIGKCCVCGAPNRLGISNHAITVHKYNTFTECGNPECDPSVTKKIENEEHEKRTFMKYHFEGNTSGISIPRSNPSAANEIGYLRSERQRECLYDFLQFDGKHPLILTRWAHKGQLSEKVLKYKTLARHNLHLPLIVVRPPGICLSTPYIHLNNSLYAYCCMTNQATFIPLLSFGLKSGLFSLLPIEIINIITTSYFQIWDKSI